MKKYEQDYSYKGKSYKDELDYKSVIESADEVKQFNIKEKIDNLMTKIALFKLRQIIIDEMQNEYYSNVANVKEVIDIDTHLMDKFVNGRDYMHVENLVIYENGFYKFNRFNIATSSMKNNSQIIPRKILYLKNYK